MRELKKKIIILVFMLGVSVLLSSCKFMMPLDKREEVMTEIAAIVNENYSSDDVETPYDISMTEIDELTDKHYHVYLVEDDMVIIVVDVFFQSVKGYVVSDEELEGTIVVPGLGYDNSQIGIIDRLGKSNVYSFSAGL